MTSANIKVCVAYDRVRVGYLASSGLSSTKHSLEEILDRRYNLKDNRSFDSAPFIQQTLTCLLVREEMVDEYTRAQSHIENENDRKYGYMLIIQCRRTQKPRGELGKEYCQETASGDSAKLAVLAPVYSWS